MINSFRGEYSFLSNFYECPMVYNYIRFTCSEAAFQAMKDISRATEFSGLTPSEAKKLGRRVHVREDWEMVKDDYMYDIVLSKFRQNLGIQKLLLETGKKHLEEGNTWGDRYWGTVNGVGQNKLGEILIKVREELKNNEI